MRPMFSVEKVGIDAGGSALEVTARLPAWPPTLMPTVSAMAAVNRTAVSVRLVIIPSGPPEGGPYRTCSVRLQPDLWIRRRSCRRRARCERRTVRQFYADDAPYRRAVLNRLEHDGHFIACFKRASRPAALRHPHGILCFERPVASLPRVILRVDLQEAMRVGPDPLGDRAGERDLL